MRQYFYNKEHDIEIKKNGYFKVSLLDESEIAELTDYFAKINWPKVGWFTAFLSEDTLLKREINDYLKRFFQPKIDELFIDFKPVVSTVFVKPKGEESFILPHQDPTFANPAEYSSLSIWCPLVPTVKDNGAFVVVPQTHLISQHPITLPTALYSFDYKKYRSLFQKHEQIINTKIGEVIIFDNHLIHYSYPNRFDEFRICVTSRVIPQEAPVCVYSINTQHDEPQLNIHETDEETILKTRIFDVPNEIKITGTFDVESISNPYKQIQDFLEPPLYKRVLSRVSSAFK